MSPEAFSADARIASFASCATRCLSSSLDLSSISEDARFSARASASSARLDWFDASFLAVLSASVNSSRTRGGEYEPPLGTSSTPFRTQPLRREDRSWHRFQAIVAVEFARSNLASKVSFSSLSDAAVFSDAACNSRTRLSSSLARAMDGSTAASFVVRSCSLAVDSSSLPEMSRTFKSAASARFSRSSLLASLLARSAVTLATSPFRDLILSSCSAASSMSFSSLSLSLPS
mmetsp:Transcript_7123/g.19470  ORF Transcript_7123/g.19470 Transcript_7123/m.19470 type:complete len:232 (+) Transcript_7123:438-1133(+)